ncbi:MAG: His Kinase A (phospho-acceptor) domain/GAF domain [Phormidesmis priestleyi Ana]|uniref:histidine kinase n=1 Tax=Phormidesmis priestleyi Ana TaxID=1666911 RepID=A0A0P7ZV09_9CYAN|nr:MAG: His Kinase A (phospho-acceptor) domain/GAF domain [Phormidesmis priestleyi Ana]
MNSTHSLTAQRMTYATSNTTEASTADSGVMPTQRLSCLLEGLSPAQRDQQRTQVLSQLNLLNTEAIPVFDEATQTVSRLLAMPLCILSIMDATQQHFKSVVGLSRLGLMNQLASARSIARQESFCTHVIDSGKTFALADATADPAFSRSLLVQQYGIQSYLGVPIFTSEGCCIGTIAVMDLLPHSFTQQEVTLLELSARWCISEFEKQQMQGKLHQAKHPLQQNNHTEQSETSLLAKINKVRFDLIVQLTQDLRNPLTSITGMANMLSREIYGPLSDKQQEYAKIVLGSSQSLLSIVNEIVEIGDLEESGYELSLAAVDIEMVIQQAIATLSPLAQQQDLQIKLTIEPGSRIWTLDKRIIKQLIYHLVFSLIKMSTAGSTIRLHISRKEDGISIAIWLSNPWLGEDLPPVVIAWSQRNPANSATANRSTPFSPNFTVSTNDIEPSNMHSYTQQTTHTVTTDTLVNSFPNDSKEVFTTLANAQQVDTSRQELGLLLSRHLTEIHGGSASVQGSPASGYRYIITLPSLAVSN